MGLSRVQRPEMKRRADKPLVTPAPPACPPTGTAHTEPAGADVLNSRPQARAEALVGRVVGPAGKQRVGGLEAKDGDTFKYAFFLVYELHGPVGDKVEDDTRHDGCDQAPLPPTCRHLPGPSHHHGALKQEATKSHPHLTLQSLPV